jgi:tripeptide aminopeptidase
MRHAGMPVTPPRTGFPMTRTPPSPPVVARLVARLVVLLLVPSVLSSALPAPANAQTRPQAGTAQSGNLDALRSQGAVARAMQAIESDNAWTIARQIALCEIPSPPFKEFARGMAFRDALVSIGVTNVRTDRVGNVFGEIRGARPGPTVMLSSHLDTVFPEGTDVKVKRAGTKLTAPGIGDDCRGLAVTLAVARQIVAAKVPLEGRLLVVGTVGEEGPGNLRGVREIFGSALRDSINYFLSIDEIGIGITNRAVGSSRYRVTYSGPGGHSYGAFGMPNPIHALGRAIAIISDLQVPTTPKVTFNVGIVSGGQTVNSIPASGSMDVDMRSESPSALADLDHRMQLAFRKALTDEKARWPQSNVPLMVKIDTIGIRPAGGTPDSAFIVRNALAAAQTMRVSAPLSASSTDANIAMSLHIPALTIGSGGVGHGAHSLDEWYDDGADGFKGPQWVLLLVLGLTGVTGVARMH